MLDGGQPVPGQDDQVELTEPVDSIDHALQDVQEGIDNPVLLIRVSNRQVAAWRVQVLR